MDQLTPDALRRNPFVCVKCAIVKSEEVKYTSTEASHVIPVNYVTDQNLTKVCNSEVAVMTNGDNEQRVFPYGGGKNSDFFKRLEKNMKTNKVGKERENALKRASKPPVHATFPPQTAPGTAVTKLASAPGVHKVTNANRNSREMYLKRNILQKQVLIESAKAVEHKKLAMRALKRKQEYEKQLADFDRSLSGQDPCMELMEDEAEAEAEDEDEDEFIDEDGSVEYEQLVIETHGDKILGDGSKIKWVPISLIRDDTAEAIYKISDRKIWQFIRDEIPFEKLLE